MNARSDLDADDLAALAEYEGPRTVDELHHLTRMAYHGHRLGYRVRIKRAGQATMRFFADADFDGGHDAALAAALAWRDEQLQRLGGPTVAIRSNTSYLGVTRWEQRGQAFYRASWPGGARSFSVSRLGEEGALEAAIAARAAGLAGRTRHSRP